MKSLLALFRFHLASSIRVALAAASLQVMIFVIVVQSQPDPEVFLRQMAWGLATGRGSAPLVLALWAAGVSLAAARRVAHGTRGWHAHLPASEADQRRAFILALVGSQGPVAGLWIALWFGGFTSGAAARPVCLFALPVVVLGAAYAAVPFLRLWLRLVAWGAVACGLVGSWALSIAGAGLLAACEALGGPLYLRHKGRERHDARLSPRLLPAVVALRSLGLRLPVAYLGPLLALGSSWLFLRNNTLQSSQAVIGVRTGCGLAVALLLLYLAGHLMVRRPPWSWSRSLPWSARRRVLDDAAFLAGCGMPLTLASLWLHAGALLPMLVLLLYLSIRLAAAMRRSRDTMTNLGGAAIGEALIVTAWVAISAWTAGLLLALLPLAVGWARRREQELKVSLWRERHYAEAGDPLS